MEKTQNVCRNESTQLWENENIKSYNYANIQMYMQKTKDVKSLGLCKESKYVIKNYKVTFNI